MAILNLETQKKIPPNFSLFNLGFRPFFLGAGVFAILSMSTWFLILQGLLDLGINNLSSIEWHSHEMVFGFTMAIIAGFLLTAVKNWTNIDTPSGKPLAFLFTLWLSARLGWFLAIFLPDSSTQILLVTAVLDLSFNLLFAAAFARPIIISKQWNQIGLLSKIILMALLNTLFYLGYFGFVEQGMALGVYGGFFILIAFVLTMGRRVIPFFIEKGVPEDVSLKNPKWIDNSNLVLFLLLAISELFIGNITLTALLALCLFFVGNIRLINWYTPGIWKNPMLWSLYLGMGFIQLGFLFYVAMIFEPSYQSYAVHLLAIGGIGLITLGMMSRVSLGHTGRDVNQPPKDHRMVIFLIIAAAIVRVFFPLVAPAHYGTWLALSQGFWIFAFGLFVWSFAPILIKKRIDGHFG
ncbi:MAG: uncharacterized protein involved in response to NO [Thiomicrorhabdus sp.]|nr:MAG: uncharacterized protein involved in response to NO [Thiomicrorhabdus sp.]